MELKCKNQTSVEVNNKLLVPFGHKVNENITIAKKGNLFYTKKENKAKKIRKKLLRDKKIHNALHLPYIYMKNTHQSMCILPV